MNKAKKNHANTTSNLSIESQEINLKNFDIQLLETFTAYMQSTTDLEAAIARKDYTAIGETSKFLLRLFYSMMTLLTDREISHQELWKLLEGEVRELKGQVSTSF